MEINKSTGLKIISVILAVLLWALIPRPGFGDIVRLHTDIEYPIVLPVEVRNIDEGLLLIDEPPLVLLTVRSIVPALVLDMNYFKVFVDAQNRLAGTHTLSVQVVEVPGFQVKSLEPSSVQIELVKAQSKSLPVEIGIINPPMACVIKDLQSIPYNITLKGNADLNLVNQILAIVKVKDIPGLQSFTTRVIAMDNKGIPIEGVSLNPEEVTIQLTCE